MSLSVAADTRPELGEDRAFFPAELRRSPTVSTGIRSGRFVFHSFPRTLRRRRRALAFGASSRGFLVSPTSTNSGGAVLSGCCGLYSRQKGLQQRGVGVTRTTTPGVPHAKTRGVCPSRAEPSRPRIRGPGKPAAARGGRARARWAGSSCSVPIIVNRRRLGGVGMGLPRPARGAAQEAAVVAEA